MPAQTKGIDIKIADRHVLDERLERAEKTLQEEALLTGQGILITRNAPGHYTAELSDQVPFGITREVIREP
jgi:hypothetical protein